MSIGVKKIIANEKPHLIKYFKNKDDAYKYGIYSSKKVDLICPCCNSICKTIIASFTKAEHVLCPYCNDGFSYPEKFFANVLKQLSVKFIRQYRIDKYRYDFCLVYNSKKYLIETDGGLGHGHRIICKNKDNDKIKDSLAVDNGFVLIRIDCCYYGDRFDYIKNSIIKSIGNIFDLSKIDWVLCNEMAVKSKYHDVIECYKNETKHAYEIAQKLDVSQSTVISYLRNAMKLGHIEKETIYKKSYDGLEDSSQYRSYYHNKKVYCYEDAMTFNSIKDASSYYGVHVSAITQSYKHGYVANGKHFVLYKDLPLDFDFKPKTIVKDSNYKSTPIFYQYSLNGDLIDKYYGCHDLKTRSNLKSISNIYRIKNGDFKTAYGFKWKIEDE
jgi:very-short-patch-repair endonuclease